MRITANFSSKNSLLSFSGIFSVLLVAFLASQVFSQVPGLGRCPQITVVQNFNVQRYLGRWFEIRSYPAIFQVGASCTEANYGLNPNGTVSVLNKAVRLGRPFSIEGTATLVEPGQGILIVNFPQNSSKQKKSKRKIIFYRSTFNSR